MHAVRRFDAGGRLSRTTDTTTIAYTPYGVVRIHYTLDAAGNKTKEQAASRWRTWTPQALPAPSPTLRRRYFDRPQYNAVFDC